MDTAVGVLRTVGVIFVVAALLFGTYVHQIARITASGAALAAATAAAQALDAADWDCTDSGLAWEAGVTAAARAAEARTEHSSAATATDYTLATDAGCTVVASVRVGAAGARRWLEATAVACAPTRAAAASGWTLTPTC
ncbi:MAG: hypothetical protein OXG66_15230 [Acidimicrobiaceae bacterium]|nr:hypothetical protein [Acidimicrobiaceae bacterium]